MEKSGHWIHPSQIFFSKTVLIPLRKPPRGAHTDARIDAKLSHVQHSSTDKHGPSRDQAGTRRCVPHVAPRPEPFARTFIFPGNLAGYFSAAMRPAARFATRVSAYRLPDGHPRASRTCGISSNLPCEPSRAPDADPPRRFNALDPSRKFCQLTLRFFFFFFFARAKRCAFSDHFVISSPFVTQTLATGRAGARPTFTTTTANPARARLAPPSTSPTTAAATRSTSPSVADPSTSATTAAARAPSKASTIRLCAERRTPLSTPMNTNAAGENEENDDGPTVHERCTNTPPCTKLRYHNHL